MAFSSLESIQIILQSSTCILVLQLQRGKFCASSCARALATMFIFQGVSIYTVRHSYILWCYGNVFPVVQCWVVCVCVFGFFPNKMQELMKYGDVLFLSITSSPSSSPPPPLPPLSLCRLDSVASEQLLMSSGSKNSLFILHILLNLILTLSQLHIKENSSSVLATSLQTKNMYRHVG